jgi:hypothetical protein
MTKYKISVEAMITYQEKEVFDVRHFLSPSNIDLLSSHRGTALKQTRLIHKSDKYFFQILIINFPLFSLPSLVFNSLKESISSVTGDVDSLVHISFKITSVFCLGHYLIDNMVNMCIQMKNTL